MKLLLKVNNISVNFGEFKALQDISLEVNEGEILGVIGHNGSGKTTLFKIILGIINSKNGEVKFLVDKFDLKNQIGYLPEQRGLFDKTSIIDQLLYFGYLKGKSKKELIPQIDYWLKFFNLLDKKKEKLINLSKGNQQKIQFIVSVIHNPKLLILDEPFSGLDPINIDVFIDAIKTMRDRGSAIIYSSHKLDSIEEISDRVLFINKGKVVYFNTISNIKNKYSFILKIKNDSLTDDILVENKIKFTKYKEIYEIVVNQKSDAEMIYDVLPNKYSDIFTIEKQSLESIYRHVNGGSENG